MSFLSSLSTGQLMLLAWLVLQLVSWLTKKNVPAGPPGGNVIAIHTKEEYEEAQRKAKESGALLCVDFSATWCGPCRAIGPKFAALSEKYPSVVFLKVDVDEVKAVASSCGVRAMPTFMFFLAGAKVEDFAGADEKRIEATLVKHGARAAPPPPAEKAEK